MVETCWHLKRKVVTILSIHFGLSSPGSELQLPVVTVGTNQDEGLSLHPWVEGRSHSAVKAYGLH